MNDDKSLSEIFPKRFDVPILIALCAIALGISLSLPLFRVEKMLVWKTEYSVMTGVIGLFQKEEYFLSAILFFFSIVFPIIKLFILAWIWMGKLKVQERKRLFYWVGALGKWSMLDVFIVAILIVVVKIGPLATATPLIGVYVFACTILAMILTTTWVERLNQ